MCARQTRVHAFKQRDIVKLEKFMADNSFVIWFIFGWSCSASLFIVLAVLNYVMDQCCLELCECECFVLTVWFCTFFFAAPVSQDRQRPPECDKSKYWTYFLFVRSWYFFIVHAIIDVMTSMDITSNNNTRWPWGTFVLHFIVILFTSSTIHYLSVAGKFEWMDRTRFFLTGDCDPPRNQ